MIPQPIRQPTKKPAVSEGTCGPWRVVARDGSTSISNTTPQIVVSDNPPAADQTAQRRMSLADSGLLAAPTSRGAGGLSATRDSGRPSTKRNIAMPVAKPDLTGQVVAEVPADSSGTADPAPRAFSPRQGSIGIVEPRRGRGEELIGGRAAAAHRSNTVPFALPGSLGQPTPPTRPCDTSLLLARVVDAWPSLSPRIQAAILAMVQAAQSAAGDR